jgi:signal transduction histidine kinase
VHLAVEDDGIGFEPQRAEDLFGPFERRLDGPAAAQHGSGLGLTISRALVRRMGGELVAHSEGPGRGGRFVVQLQEVAA